MQANSSISASKSTLEREFTMSRQNFLQIKSIVYKNMGISLSDHKQNMVYARLARRLRVLGMSNFDDYCELIRDTNSAEFGEFTNAMTTNLTSFFRENHHFDFLSKSLLPSLIEANQATRKIRIWSAGCSSGEEPYSIALVVNSFEALKHWDVKILATDLDTNVVAKAKIGVYPLERVETVPKKYFGALQRDSSGEFVKVKGGVKSLITFKQLNLLHTWPMKGPFDCIFCRNVVIYFDSPTQKNLFDRYANMLTEKGHLIIGHSENLSKVCDRFDNMGKTIYQKLR